jgi:hypothetical protein
MDRPAGPGCHGLPADGFVRGSQRRVKDASVSLEHDRDEGTDRILEE